MGVREGWTWESRTTLLDFSPHESRAAIDVEELTNVLHKNVNDFLTNGDINNGQARGGMALSRASYHGTDAAGGL